MENYGTFILDQNNKKNKKQHIAKFNNNLGGQKIDETLDRGNYANHDLTRQKENLYLIVNEEVCGEFDFQNKKVKDENFNSDKALKEYIKKSRYYSEKDAYGRTHKILKDAVLCREFVFVYSKDQEERMKPNIEEWAKDNMKFLKKAFPTFEWVLAVVHMHEGTPHICKLSEYHLTKKENQTTKNFFMMMMKNVKLVSEELGKK